jgi:microcystin-dependent protein
MQELLYRVTKGEELTDLELDDNFRKLRSGVVANEAAIAAIQAASGGLVGEIKMYGGSTLPTGYLWWNGAAYSRTTYATLYSQLGITYGAGDGSTTFNVGDGRGSFPIGANPMGGLTRMGFTARSAGTNYGAESVTVPHTHTASGTVTITPFNITPAGTIAVVAYVGTAPVTVTVTVNTTNISYTPEGSVAVSLDNGVITGKVLIAPLEAGVQVPVNGASCLDVNANEATLSVIDCASPLAILSDDIAASLATTNDLASDVTVTSSPFTGTATNFNHTHTASATGSNVTLNHTHTAVFAGTNQLISPAGSAALTVDSASPSVSLIPPAWCCNFIVKY